MIRAALTGLSYALVLLAVTALTLFIVLVLAGPHAGLLPQPLEIAVVVLGWLSVLVVPVWAARRLWRYLGLNASTRASRERGE